MPNASVLVVDDSPEMVATLSRYLSDHHWNVHTAFGGPAAIETLARTSVDVVLTDLKMKGMDGIDVLDEIRRLDAVLPVVLMTAFGTVESAVEAIQRGAYHYVMKPFKLSALRSLLERAVKDRRTRAPGSGQHASHAVPDGSALASGDLEQTEGAEPTWRRFVGVSASVKGLLELIHRVAKVPSPVLVVGETGTGKELVARSIHEASDRAKGPFVTLSCAALPESALESELFGHAAGAFPGASHARVGLFAKADRGTLFLDEVADLPVALQGKILRALESGEIRSVGDDTARRVDVRCIASTHADLGALVQDGRFRRDLYFRLNVIPIHTVPLRERPEDLPSLVGHFLAKAQERTRESRPRTLTTAAAEMLRKHDWPGNVRELENLIHRLVVTTTTPQIDAAAIEGALVPLAPADPADALAAAHLSLKDVENRYVDAVLRRSRGNKASAAAILGIDVSTIYRRRGPSKR